MRTKPLTSRRRLLIGLAKAFPLILVYGYVFDVDLIDRTNIWGAIASGVLGVGLLAGIVWAMIAEQPERDSRHNDNSTLGRCDTE